MDLELITEGSVFTIYGMTSGEPVTQFLEKLRKMDRVEYARIDHRITQMAERGASRYQDEFNNLGSGLFEMKSRGGTRIIFFYDKGFLVICTHGFAKKSQKTPCRQLELARARKTEYEQHRRQSGCFKLILQKGQQEPERQP